MGLQLFEPRFFFRRKCTKTDLALEVAIKNLSKLVWRLSVMLSRISLKNFFVVKSLMGTPLDWKFLTHNFFFSFWIDPRKVPISKTDSLRSKTVQYDSLETRELLWVKTFMVIQVHSEIFFLDFNLTQVSAHFLPPKILWPPWKTIFGGPLWVPIWVSFCYTSSLKKSFLDFNLPQVSAHFWPTKFFNPPWRDHL